VAHEPWEIEFDPAFEEWANSLPQRDAEALLAAIRVLRSYGPALGRPLVDTLKASRYSNMKELRPGSTGRTEVRALFAFDPERHGVFLVGGDKSSDWSKWYVDNVPLADQRFEAHLKHLADRNAAQGVPAGQAKQGEGAQQRRKRR
jgi:hypothetical protein